MGQVTTLVLANHDLNLALAGIKEPQFAGCHFAGKFIKMPVGHAAIDELGETKNTALITPAVFQKIAQIDEADFSQAAIFEERPK